MGGAFKKGGLGGGQGAVGTCKGKWWGGGAGSNREVYRERCHGATIAKSRKELKTECSNGLEGVKGGILCGQVCRARLGPLT